MNLYVPMPEWQAMAFLRDRTGAFDRLLEPTGSLVPGEVVIANGEFFGFRLRDQAVAFACQSYPEGFAMLTISIGRLLQTNMVYFSRQLSAIEDNGFQLWRLNREAMEVIARKCVAREAELFVDEIFGRCASDAACNKCCQKQHDGACDPSCSPSNNPSDSGRPSQRIHPERATGVGA